MKKKNNKKLNLSATNAWHFLELKAPYSSKIDILLSKKGLMNWYMVLIQSYKVAPDSL